MEQTNKHKNMVVESDFIYAFYCCANSRILIVL